MSSKEEVGSTPLTNFRLGPDVLAKLDELVALFAAEAGDRENRSSVLRKLISREHTRRMKRRRK